MAMEASDLLREVGAYCGKAGLAESTFGRLAVNDGKLVARLRDGGRITRRTLDRVRAYISEHPPETVNGRGSLVLPRRRETAPMPPAAAPGGDQRRNFRFFDNRQKYLLFVTTCGEKWVVANRVAEELANIRPRPPALRVFDAGIGDGTVLARVMRAMHARFPAMPFYIVGKEISLEDIRLALDKLPDRFYEHPASVVVLTNMFYSEAPWLRVNSPGAAASMVWREVPLAGNAAHDFEEQIAELQPFLGANWKAISNPISGNPVYERPVVLVLYRQDHAFLLDSIIPRLGRAEANFDLVLASQPYRARVPAEFKAKRVVAPLARALGPGGRLIGIHSHGGDPGMEIINRIWPEERPFVTGRHAVLSAVKDELGTARHDFNFNAYSDSRSIFRYDMHTLPNEVSGMIGTSTLFAAWNAAIYVAQIEDERLDAVVKSGAYLEATGHVVRKHGGLWFLDESYVISRHRQ
jgi:SAM-dependent methyltransferase